MTGLALVLSAVLAAGAGGSAEQADSGLSAGDLQKAKDLFGAGQKFYKAGQYKEAIAKFEEAHAVRPHPVIFYNVAKSYEQLGENGKAMRAYRDYLRLQPDAKDKESVTDAIANLERRLKEKGQQQMLVFTDPATARIEIDGKDLGTSPASAELTAGSHKIAVRAPGFESVERSFTMSISRAQEMTVNLKPGATPAIPTAADAPRRDDPATTTAAVTPGVADSLKPANVKQATPPAKKGRVWTWVAAGVAVGAAGGGVAMGVISRDAATELHARPHQQAEAQALYNQASGLSTGANIAYGVAAGAAIAAVILFIVEK